MAKLCRNNYYNSVLKKRFGSFNCFPEERITYYFSWVFFFSFFLEALNVVQYKNIFLVIFLSCLRRPTLRCNLLTLTRNSDRFNPTSPNYRRNKNSNHGICEGFAKSRDCKPFAWFTPRNISFVMLIVLISLLVAACYQLCNA